MSGNLIDIIKSFNPWWDGGAPADTPPYRRDLFQVIQTWLRETPKRKGLVIVGPRQVGKSTLLRQGVLALGGGRHVLYASLDHPRLRDVPMDEWIEPWLKTFSDAGDRRFLLLDEAPFARDWDVWMKQYLDHRRDLFILATGSSATGLRRGSRESGVGRWDEMWMPPFSFGEVLAWKFEIPSSPSQRTLIPPPLRLVDPVIANALKDYLRRGGFPLMWETLDLERGYDQLRRDVIERALFRDIPLLYPLRDIAALERLFYMCAPETGRIVSMEKLAGDIRRSQQTVDTHLKLIAETGLLLVLKPYPGLSRRGLGGMPKLILADPALYHAAIRPLSLTLKPETEGQLLESVVAEHCASAARVLGGMLSYWRKGPLEVDLVLEIGGESIPIGITKSDRFERRDAEPLAAFLRAFPKKSSTALFLYTGEERDIPLREARGMIACRHAASYLAHLSQTAIPRPPV